MDQDGEPRAAAPPGCRPVRRELIVRMPDPGLFRRARRRFEPTADRDYILPSIPVDVTDAPAVTHADILGTEHVLLEPRSLVDMFEPDQAAARFAREVVDQHIL